MSDFTGPKNATRIQGQPVSSTAPTSGQVLAYDGAQWAPSLVGPSNLQPYTAQTTDGSTWVTLLTLALAANQGVASFLSFVAVRATGDQAEGGFTGFSYVRVGSAAPVNDPGYAALFGDPTTPKAPDLPGVTLGTIVSRAAVSGNSVLLQVKGVAGVTINWAAYPPTTGFMFFTLP